MVQVKRLISQRLEFKFHIVVCSLVRLQLRVLAPYLIARLRLLCFESFELGMILLALVDRLDEFLMHWRDEKRKERCRPAALMKWKQAFLVSGQHIRAAFEQKLDDRRVVILYSQMQRSKAFFGTAVHVYTVGFNQKRADVYVSEACRPMQDRILKAL